MVFGLGLWLRSENKGGAGWLARGLGAAENLGVGLKFDCGFKGGRFG